MKILNLCVHQDTPVSNLFIMEEFEHFIHESLYCIFDFTFDFLILHTNLKFPWINLSLSFLLSVWICVIGFALFPEYNYIQVARL